MLIKSVLIIVKKLYLCKEYVKRTGMFPPLSFLHYMVLLLSRPTCAVYTWYKTKAIIDNTIPEI